MSEVEAPRAEGTLPNAPDPRAHNVLFGHQNTINQITHAFQSKRFPQSWLITGQQGIGKATLAWHMARGLVETGKLSEDYTPSAELLARYASHNHPNIYAIGRPSDEKQGFKTQIPIENIRHLSEKMQFANTEGGWRAVIIDPIDALNTAASNALLKLLEEPPARVVFFLISHAPGSLLPTIKSRCQLLRLQGVSVDEMKQNWTHLTSDPLPSDHALSLADGSMRAALSSTEALDAVYEMGLEILARAPRIPHHLFLNFASKLNSGSRTETIAIAKEVFGLLIGRILRAATSSEILRETPLAQKIASPATLGKWAEFGMQTAKAFEDAARLNLDAEIAIFHRWLALEDMLINFTGK